MGGDKGLRKKSTAALENCTSFFVEGFVFSLSPLNYLIPRVCTDICVWVEPNAAGSVAALSTDPDSISMAACASLSFAGAAAPLRAAARPLRTPRSTAHAAAPVSCVLKEGARVRVVSPVRVFHVGKFKAGLELEGMEGTVISDVREFKGMQLSATHPWKVQFEAKDGDGKAVKVLAHLVSTRCYCCCCYWGCTHGAQQCHPLPGIRVRTQPPSAPPVQEEEEIQEA